MIITLTREEVENIVREKFNLPDNIRVLISQYSNNSIPPLEVTVNKDNQVESIKNFVYADTDSVKFTDTGNAKDANKEKQLQVIKEQPVLKKAHKTKGKTTHNYPPKLSKEELDAIYERYADIVEQFLKSGEKEQFIDLEGYSASGIRYRYNTAIKMYGFDGQCYASSTERSKGKGTARLIRKDKVK